MKKTYLGMLATAGLLGACAGTDEGVLRIEAAMRPESHPAPEGIALGLDAPPLAPPDRDVLWAPAYSFPERMGQVGTNSRHYYSGPYPYPLLMPSPYCSCQHGHGHGHHRGPRYHLEPKPGGSTPGLLP